MTRKEDPSNLVSLDGKHNFPKEFLKTRSQSQSQSFASKKSKRASTKKKSFREASPEVVIPPIQRIIENEGQEEAHVEPERHESFEEGSHHHNLGSSPGLYREHSLVGGAVGGN